MFTSKAKTIKALGFVGSISAAIALWMSGQQTEALGVFAASLSSAGLMGDTPADATPNPPVSS